MDEGSKFVVKGFNSKLLLPKKIGIGLRQTKTLYVWFVTKDNPVEDPNLLYQVKDSLIIYYLLFQIFQSQNFYPSASVIQYGNMQCNREQFISSQFLSL